MSVLVLSYEGTPLYFYVSDTYKIEHVYKIKTDLTRRVLRLIYPIRLTRRGVMWGLLNEYICMRWVKCLLLCLWLKVLCIPTNFHSY